jgi:(2R)-ethylmalonyl-CoA mutase
LQRNIDGRPASERDRPWLFRTYAGHSTAAASNALYKTNLAKGQTGLSVAFDLPTQTGYDSDHLMARGEVGKLGVPVGHLGDMRTLFDGIPLEQMNTSMTINATAAWLLALYVVAAEEQGADRSKLNGTTQNDIVKEYLSRGTYIFPPAASLQLTTDTIVWSAAEVPRWNPINICSYHLQEAGSTPVQELAFALANACAVLDGVKASGQVPDADFPRIAGRISFFVNAGVRFITEMCKMRAFTGMWDDIMRERYGVEDEKMRRFRYGVQVNSLGLTESQPENNVYRILLETLAVTLSKDARARAVQLPAWNEAMGLPRPWDQQWSLRLQQVLAFETDLLEFGDIFTGNPAIEAKVRELTEAANEEMRRVAEQGGVVEALESGYLKRELVAAHAQRRRDIESGDLTVVGVNKYTETAESPLTAGEEGAILSVDPAVEAQEIAKMRAWKEARDPATVRAALQSVEDAAREGRNIMEPTVAAARAGVTTGEWAETLRQLFGQYRPPTGIDTRSEVAANNPLAPRIEELVQVLGHTPRFLVGKPGLDGHSNGAEQIALRAQNAGFDVIYRGIRQTPDEIAELALSEQADAVGLSVLSGSHMVLAEAVIEALSERGLGHLPVIIGGIIPPEDAETLRAMGIAAVFTPKDFDLGAILDNLTGVLETRYLRRNAPVAAE